MRFHLRVKAPINEYNRSMTTPYERSMRKPAMTLEQRVDHLESDNELFNQTFLTMSRVIDSDDLTANQAMVAMMYEQGKSIKRLEEGVEALLVHFGISHPTFNP